MADNNNIHPSLRDATNSSTTGPSADTPTSLNPVTTNNNPSPIYPDHAASNKQVYPSILSTTSPYDESPLSEQQHSHPNYPPLTPQSTHAVDPHTAEPASENHADTPDYKRPRACEACRGLKVKCEPDVNNPDGPCKRCAKASRNCVVTVPSRKRQKKTDGRVAELEKKIDALTATLQASKSGSIGHDDGSLGDASHSNDRPLNSYEEATYSSVFSRSLPEQANRRTDIFSKVSDQLRTGGASPSMVAPPMVVAGQKRKISEYATPSPSTSTIPPTRGSGHLANPQGRDLPVGTASNDYADVIDRGVLTAEEASKIFDHYVNDMAPHVPAVVFPPGTTAAEIRKSKPVLFLAILSISSSGNQAELQRLLTKEIMQSFADRIICHGEKNMELIQALLVTSLWYWPPEHFEELKFYQLIHIAAVMAIDIGLGKKQKAKRNRIIAGLWRENAWRKTPPFPDSESVEARRTWLACYFMCCTASMGFRRPNLIRWTSFMSESIDFLSSSSEALPSDKFLCEWVKSQHIAENIGVQFSMDDPCATVQISDPKVQFALKGFERDLDHWAAHIPADIRRPSLKMCEHVINLYMHEVALHVDHNVEEFRPPFTEEKLFGSNSKESDLLSSAHITALSVCLTSVDGIFETFLALDVGAVRCLPIFHFVRAAYAVIVLIKMYFSAASPNSELGKVIDKDNMKVEQYLDGLLDKFRAAAEDDRCRPASKFLMVLVMLKTWFQRQKEGKSSRPDGNAPQSNEAGKSASPTNDSKETNSQTSKPSSRGKGEYASNTPLQLLSEVATNAGPDKQKQNYTPNNNNNGPTSESSDGWQAHQPYNYPTVSRFIQPPPPMTPQSLSSTPLNTAPQANMTQSGTPSWNTYNTEYNNQAASLGMDLEYSMGDGFEQAMGMTLGYGDLGKYFDDDQFFGGFFDSIGGPGMGFTME